MQKKSLFFSFLCALQSIALCATVQPEKSHYTAFVSSPQLRADFADFLTHVLLQVTPKDVYSLLDSIQEKNNPQTDTQWYTHLIARINEIKSYSNPYYALQSLQTQKETLSAQIKEHMHVQGIRHNAPIHGCLEIGTPGSYLSSVQKNFAVSGPIYVLNDQQSFTDRLRTGGRIPYDSFIHLNDYDPISTKDIPDASLDLVVCFIGLHHAKPEKLDAFIASIARVLRPGGMFILRDHDCSSDSVTTLAYMAHSIFNAVTAQESATAEQAEVRNFQPIQYWIKAVEKHNLIALPHTTTQAGDPTINTTLIFTKQGITQEEKLAQISKELSQKSIYYRPFMQTCLTATEWLSVDLAQQEAVVANKESWYKFPYFKSSAVLWKVFVNSWNQARKRSSFSDVATCEWAQTNFFIATMTSLKYLAKGITSLPLHIFDSTKKGSVETYVANNATEYGKWIEHTPFYEFDYFSKAKQVLHKIKTARDIPFVAIATTEYISDGIIAAPVKWMNSGIESRTIQLLVNDPYNTVSNIDSRITVITRYQDTPFAVIEVPRYKEFLTLVSKIVAHKKVTILEVAGNKKIQVKVRYKNNTDLGMYKPEYTWTLPSNASYQYAEIMVPVNSLGTMFDVCLQKGIEVVYIHDF